MIQVNATKRNITGSFHMWKLKNKIKDLKLRGKIIGIGKKRGTRGRAGWRRK